MAKNAGPISYTLGGKTVGKTTPSKPVGPVSYQVGGRAVSQISGGSFVCWREPSEVLKGWNAAEAYKLGFEKQSNGTFRKVVE